MVEESLSKSCASHYGNKQSVTNVKWNEQWDVQLQSEIRCSASWLVSHYLR